MVGYALILVHTRRKYLCQRMFCDVVLGGAQAACDDYHLTLRKGASECLLDLLGGVANRDFFVYGDTRCVEMFGDADRVGIYNLTDKYLIANGYDCRFNHFLECFLLSPLLRAARPCADAHSIPRVCCV